MGNQQSKSTEEYENREDGPISDEQMKEFIQIFNYILQMNTIRNSNFFLHILTKKNLKYSTYLINVNKNQIYYLKYIF